MHRLSVSAVLIVLIVVLSPVVALVQSVKTAAQRGETPTAVIVDGTCATPGDTVAALRAFDVQDGGTVRVSLTTVEIALADLLGTDHAIVLTEGNATVACGDAAGDADDVYVGVAAATDAGWGGVAWLHAREHQTRVSLFVARGLSGGEGEHSPTAEPNDEPPSPPDEETPVATARAKRAPEATATPGGQATYTSPNYHYSLSYDADFWRAEEETNPSATGPWDLLTLSHYGTYATLVGEAGRKGISALDLCAWRVSTYENDPAASNVTIREELTGDEDRATVVVDFTNNHDDGGASILTDWIGCFHAPDGSVMMSFLFRTGQGGYQRQTPLREALLAGLTFPGS